jgi:hypothetical protein
MRKLICRILRRVILAAPLSAKYHLYDNDGSLYMGRWNIIKEFETDNRGRDIMHTHTRTSRLLLWATRGKWASIRLHHICRGDHDRDFHNHPFRYKSLVLKGWYAEHVLEDSQVRVNIHGAGAVNHGDTFTFHRITEVNPGGVWTLFIMGPNTNKWGFNVDGKFVWSTIYFMEKRRKL